MGTCDALCLQTNLSSSEHGLPPASSMFVHQLRCGCHSLTPIVPMLCFQSASQPLQVAHTRSATDAWLAKLAKCCSPGVARTQGGAAREMDREMRQSAAHVADAAAIQSTWTPYAPDSSTFRPGTHYNNAHMRHKYACLSARLNSMPVTCYSIDSETFSPLSRRLRGNRYSAAQMG